MKLLTDQDSETQSPDLVAENIEQLKILFPEAFTEAKLDFEVLKQLLGGVVDEREEKYGLNWNGKRRARQLALTPSTGTLRPCPKESVDWDTTRNLMIEGDNLEVLKLLQKSYAGKVKLIYIDPPYNTGKDFVYPDDFRDNIRNYLELTGQMEAARKISSNTETSGRFHTDWLNMMYPRLKLARNFLHETGLIVIHIDEHEMHNLLILMNDIFGEENYLGTCIWDKRNPKGDARGVAYQHESLLLYARDAEILFNKAPLIRQKRNAARILDSAARAIATTKNIEEATTAFRLWLKKQTDLSGGEAMYNRLSPDGRVYRLVSMAWPNKKRAPDEYFIPLVHPATGKACPIPERGWRNPPETMQKLLANGLIEFGPDHTTQPQRRYFLEENMNENVPSILPYGGADDDLFSSWSIAFENPKPVNFAADLITWMSSGDAIVMDFFAGSGTTGHATWLANVRDGGNRRFVLVEIGHVGQNDTSIADITRARLRRARKDIKDESSLSVGDFGFRVFTLASSNIRAWEPNQENLAQTLEASIDHLKTDRTEADILFELLLKLGLDLCIPIELKHIAGKTVHSIGAGTLLVCLAESISNNDAEPLALGIADWHKTLSPAGESTVVFRDSAFASDVAKTNLTAILEQHGLANIRSL